MVGAINGKILDLESSFSGSIPDWRSGKYILMKKIKSSSICFHNSIKIYRFYSSSGQGLWVFHLSKSSSGTKTSYASLISKSHSRTK